jgi:hypothetical protein
MKKAVAAEVATKSKMVGGRRSGVFARILKCDEVWVTWGVTVTPGRSFNCENESHSRNTEVCGCMGIFLG